MVSCFEKMLFGLNISHEILELIAAVFTVTGYTTFNIGM